MNVFKILDTYITNHFPKGFFQFTVLLIMSENMVGF